jgi:hypothetical protein
MDEDRARGIAHARSIYLAPQSDRSLKSSSKGTISRNPR